MVIAVAVEKVLYNIDRLFWYNAPNESKVSVGSLVLVPFGAKNAVRKGFVFEIVSQEEIKEGLKEIYDLPENVIALTEEQVKLASWMAQNLFCSYGEAVGVILPNLQSGRVRAGFKLDLKKVPALSLVGPDLEALGRKFGELLPRRAVSFLAPKEQRELQQVGALKHWFWLERSLAEKKQKVFGLGSLKDLKKPLTPKQKKALAKLTPGEWYTKDELLKTSGGSAYLLGELLRKGALTCRFKTCRKSSEPAILGKVATKLPEPELTEQQKEVLAGLALKVKQKSAGVNLLFGVTGSGKTEVFLRLIKMVIERGDTALVLVPEIGLTAALVEQLVARFGGGVAVWHSGLKERQKLSEWNRVQSGEARVIVGTRSAVFLPIANLGLIVIDEEQDRSYLSERKPLYSAVEIAKFRAKQNSCQLVLVSATPSVASFYKAKAGVYGLFELNKRYNQKCLPEVKVVDMRQESQREDAVIIGGELKQELEANLEKGEQSIVLIGRRGYSTSVRCSGCGGVATCPNCSVSLVYHKADNQLHCHYCGFSSSAVDYCGFCGSQFVEFNGIGIEKVQAALGKIKGARVLRLDSEVITSSEVFNQKLGEFEKGSYNIMVGTQIVAKGFNFSNVTLVGVVGIDQNLFCNDFLGPEQAFSLLTQVIGRAGRFKKPGRALVQTADPGNELFEFVKKGDYNAFFAQELAVRQSLNLPPLQDLIIIGFVGQNGKQTLQAATAFSKAMQQEFGLECGEPMPANRFKQNGYYRFKIVICQRNNVALRAKLRKALKAWSGEFKKAEVRVFVDVNLASGF